MSDQGTGGDVLLDSGHTERVTEYALGIGRVMGIEGDILEKLKICSLLHDIGKIATPKEILNKDSELTESEWIEIKKTSEVGAEILNDLKQFKDVVHGIKYHMSIGTAAEGFSA